MIEINDKMEDEIFLIEVKGEVDASSSIHLDNVLQKAMDAKKSILMDLSLLDYISSAGLGVFISYIEDMKDEEISLVLFGLQPKVFQVFEILGLHNLMQIVNTKEEALHEVNES